MGYNRFLDKPEGQQTWNDINTGPYKCNICNGVGIVKDSILEQIVDSDEEIGREIEKRKIILE